MQWYLYQYREDQSIRIIRVYGNMPEVILPDTICGNPVVEIGAYCFAQKEIIEKETLYFIARQNGNGTTEVDKKALDSAIEQGHIRVLAGDYLQAVLMPDTVRILGTLAFYQCRQLSQLRIGQNLQEIGSDAFMNCRNLRDLYIRGHVDEISGLKQILQQREKETRVFFEANGSIEAAFLYPEYSQSYELIGPAHIFGWNIVGEGFRARQCFESGILQVHEYDQIFLQECAEESVETLCEMAMLRLKYPYALDEESKQRYQDYIRLHLRSMVKHLVDTKDITFIRYLSEDMIEAEVMDLFMREAVKSQWIEGTRMLLEWQSHQKKEKKDAYDFEDF